MRKIMTGVLVATVISIALVARAPAGDSQATQKQHVWWAEGWRPPSEQAAAAKPNSAVTDAITRLDSNSLNLWYVEWNSGSGMPNRILGRSLKMYGGPPAEAAQRFLEENRSFFTGLSPDNDHREVQFEIKEVFTSDPKDVGVTFRELYKGIPVYQAGPAVHFDQEGHVTGAGGTLYYIAPLDVTPTLSPQAAIEALRRATAPDSLAQFGGTPLLVWPGAPTARLAYKINISVSSGARGVFSGSAYVDAHSGEVLGRESWMRLDPGPEYNRGGAINGKDSSSVGPSDPRRHPAFKNVQIKRVPEELWRAREQGKVVKPDSQVAPFDTTLPRPRSYVPDGGSKEPPRQQALSAQGANESAKPATDGWFYSATFYDDQDFDYDGYDGRAILEWDADTHLSQEDVHVAIYGRDSLNSVVFLGQTPDYTIYDGSADLFWTDIVAPWHSRWDFRLVLISSTGDSLYVLNYGSAPQHGPALPQDVGMEPQQEDGVYVNVTNDPPDHTAGTDWNSNGFDQGTDLLFKVKVDYDSTYTLVAEVFARDLDSTLDTSHLEICIGNSLPFEVTYNNNDILAFEMNPFPGVHGHWDFTVNLYAYGCYGSCLLSSVPFGLTQGWTNVPLERWNEDGPQTTIFRPNPIHSLDDASLWDDGDQLEAVPFRPQDGAYFSVSLSHLDPPVGGLYSLTGTYAGIRDFEEYYFAAPYYWIGRPHVPPVPTSVSQDFPYLRDRPGFEAVMCYYFIDQNQTYLQALGFTQACNRQVLVDPHAYDGEDLSGYFVYDTTNNWGLGVLLYGDGGTDNAEDADDVLHEYGHAVSDNVLHGLFARSEANQTRAMEEGFSDYWACSWADSFYPGPFPSAYFGEWNARSSPSAPAYMRRLNTTKHLQDTTNNPYDDSEIWSACLWQMKEALGKRVTDSLCLMSFQQMRQWNVANPSFLVGAQYVLRADTLSYARAHAYTMFQIFHDRGILPCNCPYQGDLDQSGFIDVSDVLQEIKIAFTNGADIHDATCPRTRADVNNSGFVDVADVLYIIKTAFVNGPNPINPCQ